MPWIGNATIAPKNRVKEREKKGRKTLTRLESTQCQ